MNDKMHSDNQTTSLENLFDQARRAEPQFSDDTFTSKVMAGISRASQHSLLETSKAFNWMDILGVGLGVIACFSFIEPAQLVAWVGNTLLPSKLVLSPINLLIAGLGMGTLAFGGWWALEGHRRL
ncbi:MAG: hypothetical protein KJP04_01990 [Arenicella sp.]|nr:hypothetical protein [Arenicella sp.]